MIRLNKGHNKKNTGTITLKTLLFFGEMMWNLTDHTHVLQLCQYSTTKLECTVPYIESGSIISNASI